MVVEWLASWSSVFKSVEWNPSGSTESSLPLEMSLGRVSWTSPCPYPRYMASSNCRGTKSDSRIGGVLMERQDPSYGVVVYARDLRVQALLEGSNSPTSRSPEAVDWIMGV